MAHTLCVCFCVFSDIFPIVYYLMHTPYKDQTLNIKMQLKLLVKEARCRKISSDVKEKNIPQIIFKIVTNEIITVNYFNKFSRTFWQKHYYIIIKYLDY